MAKIEQESKSNVSASKLFTTQNIIRKKFEKAYLNRLEQENHTIKPVLSSVAPTSAQSSDLSATEVNSFHQKQPKRVHSTKIVRMNANHHINKLCERLSLILSSPLTSRAKHSHEINSILDELHDLGIIV